MFGLGDNLTLESFLALLIGSSLIELSYSSEIRIFPET